MEIFRQLSEVPVDFGPTVATIGNFDGAHRGHQWVIAEVVARARAEGRRSLAITFDPHPARVIRPELRLPLITPLEERLALLSATGLDAVLVLSFTREMSRMTAREFASEVLQRRLHVKELHEGENFRFGYQAGAGIENLEALGRELGFEVRVYTPRSIRGDVVSSSLVRKLIAEGEVSRVRALLGRSFAVRGTPASGRGFGTRYTVPTINLAPYHELLPANGVYVTLLTVGAGDAEETFEAVTNVGNRPTFGADSFTVESHLLNFHPIALEEQTPLTLLFLRRLRAEIRWPNPEALKQQIGRDVAQAKRYFGLCRAMAARTQNGRGQDSELPGLQ
ncbi:MAG: bifunctional riboflavin kinase/FMN adenylyltransferase [Acidobacteriota bacterium]|nr:bifunctional riboflavin kinase/FMN adenylyltransferase [Acidobacteriota bacterium]